MQLIPIWWRWYYWASPVAWTIYGVIASQFGDLKNEIDIPLRTKEPIDAFLKEFWGYDHDFLVPVVIAHVAWVFLFFFVFAYGIKFLNFQRRWGISLCTREALECYDLQIGSWVYTIIVNQPEEHKAVHSFYIYFCFFLPKLCILLGLTLSECTVFVFLFSLFIFLKFYTSLLLYS